MKSVSHSVISDFCNVMDPMDPMDPFQPSLSMEFFRQKYWSELPFSFPGDLPNPGIEPWSPALQEDSLLSEPPGKPTMLCGFDSKERSLFTFLRDGSTFE